MARALKTSALAVVLALVGPLLGQSRRPAEPRRDVLHAQLQEETAHPRAKAPLTILQVNDVYSTVPVDGIGGLARVASISW